MAETVFILGAGASKEAGAPVMSEFVRTIEDLDESKIPEDLRPVRESLLQAARSMGDMVSRIAFMPTNIEDLLGVVEMAEMTGGLSCRPGLNIDSLRGGLRRLIAHTLESSINFPVSGSGEMERHIEAPDSYAALAGMVSESAPRHKPAIITLNYDCALDYALEDRGLGVNYGLSDGGDGARLPKLHGSTNWTRCPQCKEVVTVSVRSIFPGTIRNPWLSDSEDSEPVKLAVSHQMASKMCPKCQAPLTEDPFICAPTWNKMAAKDWILAATWRGAAAELAEAANIFVMGYSMPKTDQVFQALLANGLSGQDHPLIRRFWVFDPEEQMKNRYHEILGPFIERVFRFETMRFSEALRFVTHEVWDKEGWLKQ